MHGCGNELRVKLKMAYLVRDCETLAIGVMKGVDANDWHAGVDKYETGKLFIER